MFVNLFLKRGRLNSKLKSVTKALATKINGAQSKGDRTTLTESNDDGVNWQAAAVAGRKEKGCE